jgi:hypothetical protein
MTEHRAPILMPAMSAAQAASWQGLMDLHDKVPTGWTLVGGQLVHLHCAERGAYPERPTDDVDTVVDVRAATDMLETFTQGLLDLDFKPDMSGEGLQHRWRRGAAQIDVLLPEGVGERTAARPGAGGAPTLPTPGGTQALTRSEPLMLEVEGRVGTVRRPNLVGALVMKAAAHTAVGDVGLGRHRLDFVTLSALVARNDFRETELNKKDRMRLRDMLAACRADAIAMEPQHAAESLNRLERAGGLS